MEEDETNEQGIVREIKEETNLDAKILRILNTETLVANNEPWIKILFEVMVDDFSNLKLNPTEHVEYKWVTLDEIPNDSENSLVNDFEIYKNIYK